MTLGGGGAGAALRGGRSRVVSAGFQPSTVALDHSKVWKDEFPMICIEMHRDAVQIFWECDDWM